MRPEPRDWELFRGTRRTCQKDPHLLDLKGGVHRSGRAARLLSGVEGSQGAPSGGGGRVEWRRRRRCPSEGQACCSRPSQRNRGLLSGLGLPREPVGQGKSPGDELCRFVAGLGGSSPSVAGELCELVELVQGRWWCLRTKDLDFGLCVLQHHNCSKPGFLCARGCRVGISWCPH